MWGIHWSPVNSPHKGQWCRALMFSLICTWINGWVNTREAGDLRCHRAHYDIIIMQLDRHLESCCVCFSHAPQSGWFCNVIYLFSEWHTCLTFKWISTNLRWFQILTASESAKLFINIFTLLEFSVWKGTDFIMNISHHKVPVNGNTKTLINYGTYNIWYDCKMNKKHSESAHLQCA